MVMKIKDECGIWIDNRKMIAKKFITDYTNRFKSAHNTSRLLPKLWLPKLLSELDNQELIKLPNLEEVRTALFNIDSNKTPEPDGFDVGFFKNYWHIIKNGLFNSVTEFFTNDKILKEINHTFIALILKVPNPT